MMTKKGRFVFMGAMVKGLHGWKVDFVGDTEQNRTEHYFSPILFSGQISREIPNNLINYNIETSRQRNFA
jgi:hypothetical protein